MVCDISYPKLGYYLFPHAHNQKRRRSVLELELEQLNTILTRYSCHTEVVRISYKKTNKNKIKRGNVKNKDKTSPTNLVEVHWTSFVDSVTSTISLSSIA